METDPVGEESHEYREEKKVERCYLDRESVPHGGVEDADKRVVRWIRFGFSSQSFSFFVHGFFLAPVINLAFLLYASYPPYFFQPLPPLVTLSTTFGLETIIHALVFCRHKDVTHHEQNSALTTRRGATQCCKKDVKSSIEKVLALDRAYPLPLLGAMLDKFPQKYEPASQRKSTTQERKRSNNGWSEDLEKEMREVIEVIKKKDIVEKPKYET
ncbi:hypothetical protein V8G54_026388 [Vigna mungo]|uniref:Uncharacterized protein n=1 Tax=Vigna mungo TaxID=3915 RepID=A0AAQ3RPV4_VIGMU